MKIYAAEIADGLEEQIKASGSIAFTTAVEGYIGPVTSDKVPALLCHGGYTISKSIANLLKINASHTDEDLFYNRSILVSSVWNKNDDIFDKAEMWAARHTPEHKPDNINHDDKLIVGHMTSVWAMDDDGNVIADDTAVKDLPDLYHLVTGSVIYRNWSDKDYHKMVADLIEKIQAGKMFVSMECLFSGFDYGVKSADGTFHIIPRDESSAFLTKHLRAYKGTGEYEGYKIGRIVRSPIFSGKGYVEQPANPSSVILAGETIIFSAASLINPFNTETGVSINSTQLSASTTKENNDMSEVNKHLEDQVAEQKALIAKLTSEKEAAVESATKANVAKIEAALTDASTKAEASAKELADTKVALEAATVKSSELETQVKTLTEAKATVEAELATIKTTSIKAGRVNTLVAGGLTAEEAEASVAKFENLSDEQFASVAELAIAAKKFVPFGKDKKDDKKEDKKEKAKCSEETAAETLETVETEDAPTLSTEADAKAEEDTKVETTRAALAAWVTSRMSASAK